MQLHDVVIEITRQCNMACDHCLRGEPENKAMPEGHIESLFSKVDYIGSITFTGGEPSLRPDIISMILDKAKEYNVGMGSFYIATNGKTVSDEFLFSLIKLYCYCDDNEEISSVALSIDDYHDEIPLENKNKLKVFSFFSEKNLYEAGTVDEGRAKENNLGQREEKIYGYTFGDDDYFEEGMIYLNCEGFIISSCDLSYERQRENQVCHVDDLSYEIMKNYEPLDVYEE